MHSFFASAAGFEFDLDDTDGLGPEDFYAMSRNETQVSLSPNRIRHVTVTARGMALLAKCGYLPKVPEGDISDKSKANELAKFLVVLPAS